MGGGGGGGGGGAISVAETNPGDCDLGSAWSEAS